jgi:hypothetical protein
VQRQWLIRRQCPESEKSKLTRSAKRRNASVALAHGVGQGEGSDILDAIVAEGRCGMCGTPWDRVVNVDGKRPVKIEGGCPLTCASWATGEPLVPAGQAFPLAKADRARPRDRTVLGDWVGVHVARPILHRPDNGE